MFELLTTIEAHYATHPHRGVLDALITHLPEAHPHEVLVSDAGVGITVSATDFTPEFERATREMVQACPWEVPLRDVGLIRQRLAPVGSDAVRGARVDFSRADAALELVLSKQDGSPFCTVGTLRDVLSQVPSLPSAYGGDDRAIIELGVLMEPGGLGLRQVFAGPLSALSEEAGWPPPLADLAATYQLERVTPAAGQAQWQWRLIFDGPHNDAFDAASTLIAPALLEKAWISTVQWAHDGRILATLRPR